MLSGEKDRFRLLSKSYRNTIEISEYAGKILSKVSFGRYKIDPVIRHGIPVQEYQLQTEENMYELAADIIKKAKTDGHESIAVVCKIPTEAEWVGKWITDVEVLPVSQVKGLEFDVVLLWNPLTEEKLTDPKQAKLQYVAVTRALHELHILRADR